jgi:hypothetical protein
MAKKQQQRKTKVSHMKTAAAKVKVHFKGKRMEFIISLPADIEKQLAYRLASPKRYPNPRKK